ncbi:MAG: MarR family transcriptional regulator [Bacteroidota bacterium]
MADTDTHPLAGTFASPHHRLRVNLLYTATWLQDRIRAFLEPHDLTQPQFNILRILRGQHRTGAGTLSTSCLRKRMIDRASDTSRLVDRLVARGLVSKQPCTEDRRRVDVRITEAGLALLDEIDAGLAGLDAVTGALSDADAERLNALLDRLHGFVPETA